MSDPVDHARPPDGRTAVVVCVYGKGQPEYQPPLFEFRFKEWGQTGYGIEGVEDSGMRVFVNLASPAVGYATVRRADP